MARKVEVHPYDPAWPGMYKEEAARLRPVIGINLIVLYHIGSTAVPGLAAKPTIDILAVVQSHECLDSCIPDLQTLGYQAKGENGIPGRRYFQKLQGEVHLTHIHAFEEGHPDIQRHLNLRDFLQAHPEETKAYVALKQELADQYTYEPKRYTEGKSEFIRAADRRAAAWRMVQERLEK